MTNRTDIFLAGIVTAFAVLAFLICSAVTGHAQTAPNVSTTEISTAGINTGLALQNASPNTYFQNDGSTLLAIKGGGSPVTATIITQATSINQQGYGSAPLTDQTVSVPANAVIVVGPFPEGRWNNQYGLVRVSFTSVTGVSASALKVPQ